MPLRHVQASGAKDFLFDLGVKFYQQGRYDEALIEFKKSLMVDPNFKPALQYISLIQKKSAESQDDFVLPGGYPAQQVSRQSAVSDALDYLEGKPVYAAEPLPAYTQPFAQIIGAAEVPRQPSAAPQAAQPAASPRRSGKPAAKEPRYLVLDSSYRQLMQPIEIEQNEPVIIVGNSIRKYLSTESETLSVRQLDQNQLLLTGKEVGYAYVHVWDANDRWTSEFLIVPARLEGVPTYEELTAEELEKDRYFRFRYNMDWYSTESGLRFRSLDRDTYSWSHGLTMNGPTPYGDFDSSLSVRVAPTSTDLTYVTVGLEQGRWLNFRDFSLRAFDFSPGFSNLSYPGGMLRGVRFSSPVFRKKLDYTVFWGREGGGRYGNLSPSLSKTKNSFLEGANVNFAPTRGQVYRFSVVHGHGRDRDAALNNYGYDLISTWSADNRGLSYEVAHDSQKFAHLLKSRYTTSKLGLSMELRDINRAYNSVLGRGWAQGELGALLAAHYTPSEKLSMNGSINVYQDRLYPAEDRPSRPNEDLDWHATYQLDPLTSLSAGYSFNNDLGRISQSRSSTGSLSFNKTIKTFRDIYTYGGYSHAESKNYNAHLSDYINDRLNAGVRLSLLNEFYWFANWEQNWVNERWYGSWAQPWAWETGVDWSNQIGLSDFYTNFRFLYRDEEDTDSRIRFLSGEDYIEGYSELTFRPSDDTELYGACRMRNVWKEYQEVVPRLEMNFNAGMRYVWQSGFRWDAIGSIEGYVFKDLNADGLRQRDEAPIEGAKVFIGKDKSQTTDVFGHFAFPNIKGAKTTVVLDTSSLPSGFVPTVLPQQEVSIMHGRAVPVYFGIASRSEISGMVFVDGDGDGFPTPGEQGVGGVSLSLDDGAAVTTDSKGRYVFSNCNTGMRSVTLNVESVPVEYLPRVPVSKEVDLYEGITYVYNIPLEPIEQ